MTEGMVMHLPSELSFEQGAAVPETWITAFLELILLGELTRGQAILIHAGRQSLSSLHMASASLYLDKVMAVHYVYVILLVMWTPCTEWTRHALDPIACLSYISRFCC